MFNILYVLQRTGSRLRQKFIIYKLRIYLSKGSMQQKYFPENHKALKIYHKSFALVLWKRSNPLNSHD